MDPLHRPTCVTNTKYYKISGKYTYGGELVITRGVLYFFPFADLEEERQQRNGILLLCRVAFRPAYLLALLILLPVQLLSGLFRQAPISRSRLVKEKVWDESDSNETLQRKLDCRISEVKEKKLLSSSSLPVPSRYLPGDLSTVKMSVLGNLSFDAQHDHHDFHVGAFRRKGVLEALEAAGFLGSGAIHVGSEELGGGRSGSAPATRYR